VSRRTLGTALLVLAVVALVAVPLLLDDGSSDFTGTDSQAVSTIDQSGYEPWFSSVLPPLSQSVESGLFALQAALGGGALGYVLGRLRGRRKAAPAPAPATDPGGGEQ
jgi:cobalt/nickel transport protein